MGKKYIVDTSVIIDNPENLLKLSDHNTNKIILTDVVLSELDKHKMSDKDDVRASAREFFNLIVNSKFKKSKFKTLPQDTAFETILKFKNENIKAIILTRDKYKPETIADRSSLNDKKIIEVVESYKFKAVTNDTSFKAIAQSKGCKVQTLRWGSVESPDKIKFMKEVEVDLNTTEEEILEMMKEEPIWSQIKVQFQDRKDENNVFNLALKTYIKTGTNENPTLKEVKDEPFGPIKPIGEQKVYMDLLLDKQTNLVVVAGSTGSGKTLIALQAGIKLVADKSSPINGIIYMRHTVNVEDKFSALGFRKGGDNEKLAPFHGPLYGAINTIAEKRAKKQFVDKDERERETANFIKKYNIEFVDIAFSRGVTYDNKYVIFDEGQNAPNHFIKTIGTRIGRGSKGIFMGDFGQVDHPYLSENRNGLVTLMLKAKEDDFIAGVRLYKTVRSDIAEWFQKNL